MGLIYSTSVFNHVSYKSIGLTMYSDKTLTNFALISTICTCIGRFFAGPAIDKMGLTKAIRYYVAAYIVILT